MRVPGHSVATARIYSDPIRRFADLDFAFWRRKVQKSSFDLRFLLAYRWFDVIPVERFRIRWGAAMLIETTLSRRRERCYGAGGENSAPSLLSNPRWSAPC